MEKCKIITLSNQKGGVGKTTTTYTFDELIKRYKENAKKAGSSISEEKKKEYEEKLSN